MDQSLSLSLLKWLRTFPAQENLTLQKLTDGVEIARILNHIAPEFFNAQWLSKIKTDVGDNWRLKVSNLRKVQEGVVDYYNERLGQSIRQLPSPDLNKIAEMCDETELGRLLQRVLGCAINCEQKQRHIEAIMGMEENVQAVIVKAIQDLMNSEGATLGSPEINPQSIGPPSFHPQVKTLVEQLETTSLAKEEIERRCNELDLQISVLTEEKVNLKTENEKLIERIEILETGADTGASSVRYKDLRKQVDSLQDELYKVETSRDEYKARAEGLEKDNLELNSRNEDLQMRANKSRVLEDELDALRGMKERVEIYEGTIETYKKKFEELSDLRRQVKILEEKNADYMNINMELEEEVKKSGTWRPQLDLCRKQVTDLHQKLADETKKTDRQIFENKKLTEKLEALFQEKERLILERDNLKENMEELKLSALNSSDTTSRPSSDLSDIETLEIIPPEIREKMARLQHENRVLKEKATGKHEDSAPVLQSMLSDLQERHEKLLQENRDMHLRILELESDMKEAKASSSSLQGASSTLPKSSSETKLISDLEKKLSLKNEKIQALEDNLGKKETEMSAMEERYKRYLGKAKSVIKTLDPKHNPALVPDVSVLRNQLTEKERLIENMERESEKNKKIRETEEKLITTAFYNIGMQMHRQMMNQRLAPLDHSQSFLSRQRQTSGRRNMSNNTMFQY